MAKKINLYWIFSFTGSILLILSILLPIYKDLAVYSWHYTRTQIWMWGLIIYHEEGIAYISEPVSLISGIFMSIFIVVSSIVILVKSQRLKRSSRGITSSVKLFFILAIIQLISLISWLIIGEFWGLGLEDPLGSENGPGLIGLIAGSMLIIIGSSFYYIADNLAKRKGKDFSNLILEEFKLLDEILFYVGISFGFLVLILYSRV